MTKYERTKLWMQRNQDKIMIVGISVVVIGFVVVGVKSDMAYRDRMAIQLDGYIDELNALHRAKELV